MGWGPHMLGSLALGVLGHLMSVLGLGMDPRKIGHIIRQKGNRGEWAASGNSLTKNFAEENKNFPGMYLGRFNVRVTFTFMTLLI